MSKSLEKQLEKALQQNELMTQNLTELTQQLKHVNEELALQREQNQYLLQQLFGLKKETLSPEKIHPNQTDLFEDDPSFSWPEQTGSQSEEETIEENPVRRHKKKGHQKEKLAHLPVVEHLYRWEYFKHHVNENLESDHGKAIYAQRKIDGETIFDRLKGGFGMRRTHVRGKQAVHTDIGMMLMSMNLTKLALEVRRKPEAFQHKSVKNKNRDETITFMIISSRFLFLELVISQHLFHFLGTFPLGAYF